MMAVRGQINPAKVKMLKELKELINTYKVIGLVNVQGVPANALHGIRNNLRGQAVLKMFKKKIIKRAFEEAGKENLMKMLDAYKGISSLIFTNMDPIKLSKYMDDQAVEGYAKPGDIAPKEIVVKAGDTGIPPGPIISELTQFLGLQCMTKNGTIHVRQDKVTHKPGDIIEAKQAQLLARLDIKPILIKLDFYIAWSDGEIIPEEVLHLDEEKILEDVRLGASQAFNLAMALEWITPITIEPLLMKGIRSARALGLELPVFIPELLEAYFAKAIAQANYVNATAMGIELTAPSGGDNDNKDEEPEPEPEKEEDEPVGLGALFG